MLYEVVVPVWLSWMWLPMTMTMPKIPDRLPSVSRTHHCMWHKSLCKPKYRKWLISRQKTHYMYLPHAYTQTCIQYTSEPPTSIGIDMFLFLPWLSGQRVVDTGRAELPTHWIFIRPQITETTGMCAFIFTAKPPATRITQQPHSPAIPIALHSPFPLSLSGVLILFSHSISLSSFIFS